MADNFGLKIGVEDEKEFEKALADINSSFKVLGSEMQLVESQFDKQDKSVEALTARNEVLNKQIAAQKDKISTLQEAIENAVSNKAVTTTGIRKIRIGRIGCHRFFLYLLSMTADMTSKKSKMIGEIYAERNKGIRASASPSGRSRSAQSH